VLLFTEPPTVYPTPPVVLLEYVTDPALGLAVIDGCALIVVGKKKLAALEPLSVAWSVNTLYSVVSFI
jgi:hypothetical protein